MRKHVIQVDFRLVLQSEVPEKEKTHFLVLHT